MDKLNKPKNQNPNGLHDLGQIHIKSKYFDNVKDHNGLTIAINYYGNKHTPGGRPADCAQLSLVQGQWSTCGYFTPEQLRKLAATFCDAARQIELGIEIFEAEKYLSNIDQKGI